MRRLFVSLLICSLGATSFHAHAETKSQCDELKSCFDTIDASTQLPLKSAATFTWYGFRVYHAALFTQATVPQIRQWISSDEGTDVPIALTLHYFRDFSIDDFITSGREILDNNPTVNISAINSELNALNALYQPIQEGEQYTIAYLPEVGGLQLYKNRSLLGTIPGRSFARAYLSIWLSDFSVKEKLTKTLLNDS